MAQTVATMTLDDEMPWRPLFPDRQDFYDDTGFTFTAEAGPHDIPIGNFIYTFQGGPGRPRSQWLGDGIAHNGLIVILPRENRGRGMSDNPFSRSRQLPAPVVWSYGTREDAVRTGVRRLRLRDLRRRALGRRPTLLDPQRPRRARATLLLPEVRSDRQRGHRQGRLRLRFAIHLLDGDVWVWGLGNCDDPMFFLTVEGRQLEFVPSRDGSRVRYQPLDPWHDPRSGLYLPSRWRIELESAEGRLELDAFGNGRAYYPWEFKRGYQIMYWHLGHANGTFTWPDGRTVPIRDQLIQHEIVKNIIVHQETLAGPRIEPSF
jgi:hypothetical protein